MKIIHTKITTAIFISLLSIISLTGPVLAETYNGPTRLSDKTLNDATINGPARLSHIHANMLDIHGPLQFTDLHITHDFKIAGPVRGTQLKCDTFYAAGPVDITELTTKTFDAKGPVHLQKATIYSATTIKGPAHIQDSALADLTIQSNKTTLEHTTLNNIIIQASGSEPHQKQLLILKGNTTIKENITFESAQGIIESDETVKIIGKIHGAKVIKK